MFELPRRSSVGLPKAGQRPMANSQLLKKIAIQKHRSLFVAPRSRKGQISLNFSATKSPFYKGGFRGNVNILYCTVLYSGNYSVLFSAFRASVGGVARGISACKIACKGRYISYNKQHCCLKAADTQKNILQFRKLFLPLCRLIQSGLV